MPKTNSFISWIGMTGESFGNRKGTPEFRTPHTHHHGERATRPKNSPTEGLISVVQNPTSHNIDLPRKTQREHDRLLLGNIRAPLKNHYTLIRCSRNSLSPFASNLLVGFHPGSLWSRPGLGRICFRSSRVW